MNFESSVLWALLRRQGLGSTGVVASQDRPPPLRTPKGFHGTMGFVGAGGNLLNSAKRNLWRREECFERQIGQEKALYKGRLQ